MIAAAHSTQLYAYVWHTFASSPATALSDAGNAAGFDEGSNVSRKAWPRRNVRKRAFGGWKAKREEGDEKGRGGGR